MFVRSARSGLHLLDLLLYISASFTPQLITLASLSLSVSRSLSHLEFGVVVEIFSQRQQIAVMKFLRFRAEVLNFRQGDLHGIPEERKKREIRLHPGKEEGIIVTSGKE